MGHSPACVDPPLNRSSLHVWQVFQCTPCFPNLVHALSIYMFVRYNRIMFDFSCGTIDTWIVISYVALMICQSNSNAIHTSNNIILAGLWKKFFWFYQWATSSKCAIRLKMFHLKTGPICQPKWEETYSLNKNLKWK